MTPVRGRGTFIAFKRRLEQAGLKLTALEGVPIEQALQEALARGSTATALVIGLRLLADIEAAENLLRDGRIEEALAILREAQTL